MEIYNILNLIKIRNLDYNDYNKIIYFCNLEINKNFIKQINNFINGINENYKNYKNYEDFIKFTKRIFFIKVRKNTENDKIS